MLAVKQCIIFKRQRASFRVDVEYSYSFDLCRCSHSLVILKSYDNRKKDSSLLAGTLDEIWFKYLISNFQSNYPAIMKTKFFQYSGFNLELFHMMDRSSNKYFQYWSGYTLIFKLPSPAGLCTYSKNVCRRWIGNNFLHDILRDLKQVRFKVYKCHLYSYIEAHKIHAEVFCFNTMMWAWGQSLNRDCKCNKLKKIYTSVSVHCYWPNFTFHSLQRFKFFEFYWKFE